MKGTEKGSAKYWPTVPLGEAMWAFVHDNTIANLSRTYISAQLAYTLGTSALLSSCPDHPSVYVFKMTKENANVKCPVVGCNCCLCCHCKKWHASDACDQVFVLLPGFRECPNCHNVVEKGPGCNHIDCRCKKHFCYYCGGGPFNVSNECYAHHDY